jgi:hypothetical protein
MCEICVCAIFLILSSTKFEYQVFLKILVAKACSNEKGAFATQPSMPLR